MDPDKSVQQATAAQRELLEMCQEGSRFWLDRVQSEIALWADLGSKLPKARSVPEAFEAYGNCVSRQMKMTAEDAQHLLNDWQQVARKVMGSLSGGWSRGAS